MTVKNMMSSLSYAMSGVKLCWVRNEDESKVYVLAIIPESTRAALSASQSNRLADRAGTFARREAGRIGSVISSGVFMGGNGDGSVFATGIADLPMTPDIERRLTESGISQLR
jgi:hypothetical protein